MTAESFDLAVCNTMAGSNAPSLKAASILTRTLLAFPDAVAVGVVEASNLLGVKTEGVVSVRDPRALTRIQHRRLDKAGVALIVDSDRFVTRTIRWRRGVRPYINGKRIGMRTRWILVVTGHIDGQPRKVRVLHLPPKRYWDLWPVMVKRIGKRGADLADWNKLARAVGPATGKRASMKHIIGITTPLTWQTTVPRSVDVGADHPAVGITVQNRQRKERK